MTDHPKPIKGTSPHMVLVALDEVDFPPPDAAPAERPDFPNVAARFLEGGWRLWHLGRWHQLIRVQRGPHHIICRTDEQTGTNALGPTYRTFIINPDILVFAEQPAA